MRLLRFLAVSFCVSSLFLLSSSGQTPAQTSPGPEKPFASQVSPEDQAKLQRQVEKLMAEMEEQARQRAQHPDPFAGDPGIIISKAKELQTADSNRCWSIVTYHFSHEQNPRLESVTTCTPDNAITTEHARRYKKYEPPVAPLLMQTNMLVK
jgi:hypothetical protein